MEQLQETYEAGGFVFRTKKEAELAQREIEGTKYLRQKLDMENPNAVFSIYQNLIEQDLFETPVGYCFLKELRDYLLMIPAISNEEVLAIPIRYPQTEEEEKKQKKEQKKEENLEEKQDVRQLRHSFRMAIAGLLLLVLVATGTTYAWFLSLIHI